MYRIIVIVAREDSRCFGSGEVDFETIVVSFDRPHGGRESV